MYIKETLNCSWLDFHDNTVIKEICCASSHNLKKFSVQYFYFKLIMDHVCSSVYAWAKPNLAIRLNMLK